MPAAKGLDVLGDSCLGKVWTMRVGDGKATGLRQIATVRQISSFREDTAGELYALSLRVDVHTRRR